MPEELHHASVRVGDEEHIDVYFTPVVPLQYIKVNVKINRPLDYSKPVDVKLKTRFQILKECF